MSEVIAGSVAPNVVSRRQRRVLDKLEAFAGVSAEAVDSILNFVNPFPDYTPKRVGWPDAQASPTVVVVDTYEVALVPPSGLAAGQTWDAHIAILPVSYAASASAQTVNGFAINNAGALTGGTVSLSPIGPLTIMTAPSGTSMDPLGSSAGVTYYTPYGYGPQAGNSLFRKVAQGLELVNTSAQLYKGGMAYGYRMSTPKTSAYTSPATAGLTAGVSDLVGCPPQIPANVVNYPNTYEGMAEDGLYVINTPSTYENPYVSNIGSVVLWSDLQGGTSTTYISRSYGLGCADGWCFAGGFLTGLAQNASFTVRFRTYLEIAPLWTDYNNLIRLTNPPVPWDPVSQEILNRILVTMPAGCPYTDNPLGEWFDAIMESIEDLAPAVGSALGTIFPPAKTIGKIVSKGAKLGRELNGGKRKQPRQKKKKLLLEQGPSTSKAK